MCSQRGNYKMKRSLLGLGLLVGSLVFSGLAMASEDTAAELPYHIQSTVDFSTQELALTIEDTLPVTNACEYYVQRFEYIDALHALNVVVQAPPCFVDRVAKRKVQLKWIIPSSLRNQSQFAVIVNSVRMGTQSISGQKAEFKAGSSVSAQ